jgi:hypothetical protein
MDQSGSQRINRDFSAGALLLNCVRHLSVEGHANGNTLLSVGKLDPRGALTYFLVNLMACP